MMLPRAIRLDVALSKPTMRIVCGLLLLARLWVCPEAGAGGDPVDIPSYVVEARSGIQRRIESKQPVSATAAGNHQEGAPRDSVHVLHWAVAKGPNPSGDSVVVIYCGVKDSAFLGICKKNAPDSVIGLSTTRFCKNKMFGGGVIRLAGDVLKEGQFEVLVNYFEGFQSEAVRVLRLDSHGDLKSLSRVRSDGNATDHFSAWFGIIWEDLDGDGVPEITEHTYGHDKSDRQDIIYRWDGSVFREWKRE